MALKTYRTDRRPHQLLAGLVASAVDEISAFYAVMARILVGRLEDFSDREAMRRARRLNLVAAKQQIGKKIARRPF